MDVPPRDVWSATSANLVVCCDRQQGGLHSKMEGATATLLINGREVDILGMREIPSGHTDYFHRTPNQEIPLLPITKTCGTVYSFNVPIEFLRKDGPQKIVISIDAGVRWDIDYVCLVLRVERRRVRRWLIAAIFSLLGAISTLAINEAWKYFFRAS